MKTKSSEQEVEEKNQKEAAERVFATAVKEQLALSDNTWTGDETEAVVRQLVRRGDGESQRLPPDEDEILRLICNPTIELQMQILEKILTRNEVQLNKFERAHVRRVINPQIFRGELVKAKKITVEEKPEKVNLAQLLG